MHACCAVLGLELCGSQCGSESCATLVGVEQRRTIDGGGRPNLLQLLLWRTQESLAFPAFRCTITHPQAYFLLHCAWTSCLAGASIKLSVAQEGLEAAQ